MRKVPLVCARLACQGNSSDRCVCQGNVNPLLWDCRLTCRTSPVSQRALAGLCFVAGIQGGPDRGRQTQRPAVDLNTNVNFFVAQGPRRRRCESAKCFVPCLDRIIARRKLRYRASR